MCYRCILLAANPSILLVFISFNATVPKWYSSGSVASSQQASFSLPESLVLRLLSGDKPCIVYNAELRIQLESPTRRLPLSINCSTT